MSAPRISIQQLQALRTIDDVLELLADKLDWPIDVIDTDDAVFDYSAEELGIPADQIPALRRISQLRPLVKHQPWGIFFLEFSGPRLPITPLRRLLQKLVTARRATRGHTTWKLEQLLFVVTTDTGESVEFHFVAFRANENHLAEVRSLPLRPQQSPKLYLERLAKELLPHLAWPTDTNDSAQWALTWKDAFALRHGEVIAGADQLAERMATVATELRSSVQTAMKKEAKNGPFHRLLASVHTELVAGVDETAFADMCAQTLVYGTLTARVTDPEGFGASPSLTAVPLANPFLTAFFEQVHDQVIALELPDDGLEDLVADLRSTNVEAILDRFGDNSKGGDPVVHFYEEFLKRYDAKMRADAGAFYTPQPVVEFMVRAVDQILKDTFGMPDGLADPSTWVEVCRHLEIPVPKGIDPKSPFLSMLDPATGTGTYLVEWLRRAEQSFKGNHPKGDWAERLSSFVLPSMHAFEIMLAPYAIAHLKVALEAHSQGLDGANFAIYLTDTLEHPAAQASFETMTDPVAEEGSRAAELKERERFSVVIGNPPYDRQQQVPGASASRKGGVVRHGAPGIKPLLDDITEVMSAHGLGVHAKNLYNDYVYFWRWATWQATQLPPGPGVAAFITASSYLDGKSMAGLRAHLRDVFDELWIVDLGGDSRGAQVEENVFDIRTPVAIAIGIRTTGGKSCVVRYRKISGDRADKFKWLKSTDLGGQGWTEITGSGLEPLTPPGETPYFSWPEITELFPFIYPGVKAGRTWVIGPTESVLERRVASLINAPRARRAALFKDSPTGRKAADRLGRTIMPGRWDSTPIEKIHIQPSMVRYAYRSFDRQYVIADPRFLDRASAGWSVNGRSQVFLTTLTSTKLGKGPVATVTPYVPDLHHFRGSFGAKDVIPLWRDSRGRVANLTDGLLDKLRGTWGSQTEPSDVVAYIYGLAGTGAYSERFAEELGVIAGPFRVPITTDRKLARLVMDLGRELLWLHTWGERFDSTGNRSLPTPRAREQTPVRSYPETFSYDEATGVLSVGSGAFDRVSPEVWSFEVSGLRVLTSWLGYRMAERKGKKSSPLDDIRPVRWTFTPELLELIAILERTVTLTPIAAGLLDEVVASVLIDSSALPTPSDVERKAPVG